MCVFKIHILSSPPVFSGVRVTRSLVLYVCFVDRGLSFCPFFLLATVLSVLLRYTDSDYLFGIFKLFLLILYYSTLAEQELPTLPEHLSSSSFQWGSCYSIFSFICMFCRSLFVLFYFFIQPLCCLFFFDIRILITPLLSSNSSLVSITRDTIVG